jgi:hypothetical protein
VLISQFDELVQSSIPRSDSTQESSENRTIGRLGGYNSPASSTFQLNDPSAFQTENTDSRLEAFLWLSSPYPSIRVIIDCFYPRNLQSHKHVLWNHQRPWLRLCFSVWANGLTGKVFFSRWQTNGHGIGEKTILHTESFLEDFTALGHLKQCVWETLAPHLVGKFYEFLTPYLQLPPKSPNRWIFDPATWDEVSFCTVLQLWDCQNTG